MRGQSAPDAAIARRAADQGGVIAHAQLIEIGLSADAITRRIAAGRLHPRHRGVYAVGHQLLAADGRWWAAVLALGPESFLSHDSAGHAHGIRHSTSGLVHVTVRGRNGRKRHAGIKVHRPRALPDDEVTAVRGLPITTPARTLLDLAAAKVRDIDKLLDLAEHQRLLDFTDLHALLARYPRRPGITSLKAQLAAYRGPVDVRSELERLVYQLCRDHGLPLPNVNCVVEGKVRDFCWPHCRLVVEAELTLAGYRVLRFTWEQVRRRPDYVIRTLRTALGAL